MRVQLDELRSHAQLDERLADRLFFNAGIGSPLDFERPTLDDGRGN